MKTIFICMLIIFLIVFIGLYPRYKKTRRERNDNSVGNYRENYIERRKEMQKRRDNAAKTTNYITKYNSPEDYREK